ncbi:hypothetical protein BC833DRAFT_102070 [Globomyces pollinis-pini]|nr:hypothetical protein BC833DRAFT_102070 [Globomyces pollinis-pini]
MNRNRFLQFFHTNEQTTSCRRWFSTSILDSSTQMKWVMAAQHPISATLGARPGNTLRPAPNGYKVQKWVQTDPTSFDMEEEKVGELELLPVMQPPADEPDLVIGGVDVKELTAPMTEEEIARKKAILEAEKEEEEEQSRLASIAQGIPQPAAVNGQTNGAAK